MFEHDFLVSAAISCLRSFKGVVNEQMIVAFDIVRRSLSDADEVLENGGTWEGEQLP